MRAGALTNMLARHSAPAKAGAGLAGPSAPAGAAQSGSQKRRLPSGIPGLAGGPTGLSTGMRTPASHTSGLGSKARSASAASAPLQARAPAAATSAGPAPATLRQPLQESQTGNVQSDSCRAAVGATKASKQTARAASAPSAAKQAAPVDTSADKRKRAASASQPSKAKATAKRVKQAANSDDDFM